MKKIFLIVVIIFSTIIGYSQTRNFVGAWYWSDSTNTNRISIFVRNDSVLSQNSGLVNETIIDKNLRHGKYLLKNKSLLIIKWDDKTVEKDRIKFIDNNTIRITYSPQQKSSSTQVYIFRRVVDEEVK